MIGHAGVARPLVPRIGSVRDIAFAVLDSGDSHLLRALVSSLPLKQPGRVVQATLAVQALGVLFYILSAMRASPILSTESLNLQKLR